MRRLWFRLRALLRRSALDAELDRELAYHIEEATRANVEEGFAPKEARRAALAAFGGVQQFKEATRESHGTRWLDHLTQDVRYAARQLAASPAFSGAVVLTLALGIGATTTLYTLNTTFSGDPNPLPHESQLVHVAQGTGGCNACWRITKGNYITIRDESRTLAGVSLISDWGAILRGPEHGEAIDGSRVTPGYFETLGVSAMLGRTFSAADTSSDRRNVVVLSEPFWRTQFGADSSVVGRTIVLDAAPYQIIGVVAKPLVFPRNTALWAPLMLTAADAEDRSWTDHNAVATLRPGVWLPQARAELAAIGARVAAAYPTAMRNWTFDAMPFAAWRTTGGGDQVRMLGISVSLLLLMACINLAGLLIARLTVRRRELAVRAAMGADASRIARQLLTETIALTVIGGGLGGALAAGVVRAVRVGMPPFIREAVPGWDALHVDWRAFVVALATGAVTGVVIGVWPAVRFAKISLVDVLKDGAPSTSASGGVSKTRRALVVAQTAFAIVLLAAAGLLARSLRNLSAVEPGFRVDHVLTLRVSAPPRPPGSTEPVDSLRFDRLANAFTVLPGVTNAAAVFGLPYGQMASTQGFTIDGRTGDAAREVSVQMVSVTPDYFATLQIPIVRGRVFTSADHSGAPRVTIIDQTVARRHFRDENPVGRAIVIDSLPWTIVGVAGDVHNNARGSHVSLNAGEVYRPSAQAPRRWMQVILRTRADPSTVAQDVIRTLGAFSTDLAATRIEPMEQLVDDGTALDKALAAMVTGFAAAAVLITAVGLYALISYGVATRTREFGIRRALGAESSAIAALVLGQGLRLAAVGAVVGVAGALAVMRLLRSLLFGVSPADPLTLGAVVALMCGVGIASAYVPARRAVRVDPMTCLREE
jgi:putative ABC transport system permease protein